MTASIPAETDSASNPSRRRFQGAIVATVLVLAATATAWRVFRPRYVANSCRAAYEAAAQEKQWATALEAAQRWAAVRPDSIEAWLNVAEAARQLQQWNVTADALARIPDHDPRALNALALRGDILLSELRRPTEAVENWQRMLRTAPAADLPHRRLVYVYAMTLQRTKLRDQIRLAIELECDHPEMYVYLMLIPSLQFSDGLIKCTDWLQGEPDNRTLRVAQAVHAARTAPSDTQTLFETRGVMPGDRSLLKTCRETYPDDPELLAVYIDQAIYEDDVSAAEAMLRQVHPDADHDSRFWRYRAWVALMRRRPEQAAELCRTGLERNPLDWRVRHVLADAERLLGQGEAAGWESEIAARGKTLERALMELPNAAEIDDELLRDVSRFARDSGDELVAEGLERRLGLLAPW